MTSFQTFLRRNFEPLVLSAQVFVDLGVLLLACWVAYLTGESLGGTAPDAPLDAYQKIWAMICAVLLVSFHAFGMYSPVKSLLNMQEFKAIAKSTVVGFLVFFTLLILLRKTPQDPEGPLFEILVPLHEVIDLGDRVKPDAVSRLTLVLTGFYVLIFTTASRFMSFKFIQSLHARGIGNRNVLIYGAGKCGQKLQSKFLIVPTLGLNLIGFLDDDRRKVGTLVERYRVLGGRQDLERLVGLHKVSEVFIALPDEAEDHVMGIVADCEKLGVRYHVVPRFYHLFNYKLRIESLDSVPLVTRADRSQDLIGRFAKRVLDLLLSVSVLVLGSPVFLLAALMIKRESKGPIFFVHTRIGKDGKPFKMIKFRTMHTHLSGDAPTPNSPYDPRITRIGRYLRRYSLDELPQFINVLKGEMSIVGPRPEMPFIVEKYTPMERERLRAKPGITGMWQISYARKQAIHDNVDYDLYYIENQSLLLDIVIIALTGIAVVKGTGAY